MTREEAIKEIRDASDLEVRHGDIDRHYKEIENRVEAFDMAIKALEVANKLEKLINDPLVKASGSVSTAKIRGILL